MTLQLTVTADNPQELNSILAALGNNTVIVSAPANGTPKPVAKKQEAKIDPPAAPEQENETAVSTGQAATVTIEQLRTAAATLKEEGKREHVLKTLAAFEVKGLTDLPAEKRADFLAALEKQQ